MKNICVTNVDFLGMLMVTATVSMSVERRISEVMYLSDIKMDTPPLAWLTSFLFSYKSVVVF